MTEIDVMGMKCVRGVAGLLVAKCARLLNTDLSKAGMPTEWKHATHLELCEDEAE